MPGSLSAETSVLGGGVAGSGTLDKVDPSALSLLAVPPFLLLSLRFRRSSSALSLLRRARSPLLSKLSLRPCSMLAARSATSSLSDTCSSFVGVSTSVS